MNDPRGNPIAMMIAQLARNPQLLQSILPGITQAIGAPDIGDEVSQANAYFSPQEGTMPFNGSPFMMRMPPTVDEFNYLNGRMPATDSEVYRYYEDQYPEPNYEEMYSPQASPYFDPKG